MAYHAAIYSVTCVGNIIIHKHEYAHKHAPSVRYMYVCLNVCLFVCCLFFSPSNNNTTLSLPTLFADIIVTLFERRKDNSANARHHCFYHFVTKFNL